MAAAAATTRATVLDMARNVAVALGDRARGDQDEDERPERDPVDHEWRDRMGHEVAQEEGDRGIADDEREERRDGGRGRAGAAALADVAQLEESREDDGGHGEQEGVAGGGLALEAEEESRAERRARAADAGDERERLGEADDRRVGAVQRLHSALLPRRPLGGVEDQAEHDERDADEVQVARPVLDRVAEGESEDRDGDRA